MYEDPAVRHLHRFERLGSRLSPSNECEPQVVGLAGYRQPVRWFE